MISRRRWLAAKMHLPLRQLALCLDCDECFEISCPTCPACGSATWTSLSRFLAQGSSARHPGRHDAAAKRRDDSSEILQQLIIVAGNRTHLYEHLKRGFAGNETVRVLFNRRALPRRERSDPMRPNGARLIAACPRGRRVTARGWLGHRAPGCPKESSSRPCPLGSGVLRRRPNGGRLRAVHLRGVPAARGAGEVTRT
jgi:hypothetical protein